MSRWHVALLELHLSSKLAAVLMKACFKRYMMRDVVVQKGCLGLY